MNADKPLDGLVKWLKNPEPETKSVAHIFVMTGLQVFFAGVWFIIFRRMFGSGVIN